MTLPEQNTLNSLVASVFRIDDVTIGHDAKEYLYRYRGLLTAPDSAVAYDQLAEALYPHGLMPLFRKGEDGRHVILLVPALAAPKPSNPRTNIILFILTVFSVMLAGAQIPADVAVNVLGVDQRWSGRQAVVGFHPDGASSGTVLTLSRQGAEYEVRVNWYTGGVAVEGR